MRKTAAGRSGKATAPFRGRSRLGGFTLVEVILVIVILAILAGLGLVSYSSNLAGARDSTRKADMAQLKIWLNAEKQKSGKYPLPGDAFLIVNSGSANPVARQGFMNSQVAAKEISKYPADPLNAKPYSYSTANGWRAFQIAMTMEEGGSRALLEGDYKSVSVNVLPSIVLAVAAPPGSSVEIADGVVTAGSDGSANRKKFVVNGGTANLPYGKDGTPVANSVMTFNQVLTQLGTALTGAPSYRTCQKIIDEGAWIGVGEYQLLSADGTVRNAICLGDGSEKAATGGGSVSGCPTPTTPAQSYPGCDTADIVLPNGQRWAACNVGATAAYVGGAGQPVAFADSSATGGPTAVQKGYMGAYFQWGRNRDVTTLPAAPGPAASDSGAYFYTGSATNTDWLSVRNDGLWGGAWTTSSTGTFLSLGSPPTMRGPCAAGYHVPTAKEWCDAIKSVSPTQSGGTAMVCDTNVHYETVPGAFWNALRLPPAGMRDNSSASYIGQGFGYYWNSSHYANGGSNLIFTNTYIIPAYAYVRSLGLSVRCLADEACAPTPVDGVCGSADGAASASAPSSNLCTAGTASAVAGSGPWSWTCSGTNGGASASCSAPLLATTYPGCDTADIVLSNGQRWAACNVGATKAYNNEAMPSSTAPTLAQKAYMGAYFQWGRNDDVTDTPSTNVLFPGTTPASGAWNANFVMGGIDWIDTRNSNLWGGWSTTTASGTYVSVSASDKLLMKGPCAEGYHVPTLKEWCDAVTSISPNISCSTVSWQTETVQNAVRTTLRLPLAGFRNRQYSSKYDQQAATGHYWTSTPYSTDYGTFIYFSTSQISPGGGFFRAEAQNVRCVKN